MHHSPAEFDELDLSISNLDTPADQIKAGEILGKLSGVEGVRIIERGAWVSYRPSAIDNHRICAALRAAGYDATIFQDAKTGETGISPV